MKQLESNHYKSAEFSPTINFTPEEIKTVEQFHLIFSTNAEFFRNWEAEMRAEYEAPFREKITEILAIKNEEEYKQAIVDFFSSDFFKDFQQHFTHHQSDCEYRESDWQDVGHRNFGEKHLCVSNPDIQQDFLHHDFFHTMSGFAGHDAGSISTLGGIHRHDVDRVIKENSFDDLKLKDHPVLNDRNYLPELFNTAFAYPKMMRYLSQGLNTCLGYANEAEEFDINELIKETTNILKFRTLSNFTKHESSDKYGYEKSSITTPERSSTVEIKGDAGALFLTIYNIVKNFITLPEKYLTFQWEGEALERTIRSTKKYATVQDQEDLARSIETQQSFARRAQELEAKGETFNVSINVEQLDDKTAVIIRDNGLGFDLNALKKAAKQLANHPELDSLAENNMVEPELKEALELWKFKDSVFFSQITPHFESLLTTARLSGSGLNLTRQSSGSQNSGLGLFAAKEMLKRGDAQLVIGENSDEQMGATFVILLPNNGEEIPETTTSNLAESFRDRTKEVCGVGFEDIFKKAV